MKNLQFRIKLALAFGIIILLAVLLGGFAAWRMRHAGERCAELAGSEVPKVVLSTEVERQALTVMLEVRAYEADGNAALLQKGL
ncbi:MAG: hypothetical protein NTV22_08810, partial [bacterium]|nr:hypothetical protein [bacterium]